MSVSSRILYMKSIIVLLGAIMLLACKNDIKEVNALAEREKRPDMTGENLELVYSDSARIKYRVLAPEYIKVNREKEKYEELQKELEEKNNKIKDLIKALKESSELNNIREDDRKFETLFLIDDRFD